ncbi:39S ribosomal protein L47, mitochondrial isoform X2 [Cebus imitator]|uniref:39S ribosomal protein L47, mitochondrial isoform X2 n=1 Tax=Cebus imitator TaxID=2715852 RepID=UPI001896FDD5|nr:39S ribosomal protein L47, mitochondrial isoform X2 [Cebus imitator]
MAAAGLALICRRVSAALKASRSLLTPQVPACTGFFLSLLPKSTPNVTSFHQCRFLHTTLSRKGLEEFFDDPKNWGQEKVKSGAAWTRQQLRNKSNEDLHKLWYVLLKERNMLLTLEQEAKRQILPMPSPERLEKVRTREAGQVAGAQSRAAGEGRTGEAGEVANAKSREAGEGRTGLWDYSKKEWVCGSCITCQIDFFFSYLFDF